MCKGKLNSKPKGNISNGFIDPIISSEFNIENLKRIRFGDLKPAISQQTEENKNIVYYIDDVVLCCETEELK